MFGHIDAFYFSTNACDNSKQVVWWLLTEPSIAYNRYVVFWGLTANLCYITSKYTFVCGVCFQRPFFFYEICRLFRFWYKIIFATNFDFVFINFLQDQGILFFFRTPNNEWLSHLNTFCIGISKRNSFCDKTCKRLNVYVCVRCIDRNFFARFSKRREEDNYLETLLNANKGT